MTRGQKRRFIPNTQLIFYAAKASKCIPQRERERERERDGWMREREVVLLCPPASEVLLLAQNSPPHTQTIASHLERDLRSGTIFSCSLSLSLFLTLFFTLPLYGLLLLLVWCVLKVHYHSSALRNVEVWPKWSRSKCLQSQVLPSLFIVLSFFVLFSLIAFLLSFLPRGEGLTMHSEKKIIWKSCLVFGSEIYASNILDRVQ